MVRCACDVLIAGLDSPSLRILAGLTRAEADHQVPGLLPGALAELGLDFCLRGSCGGQQSRRACPGRPGRVRAADPA